MELLKLQSDLTALAFKVAENFGVKLDFTHNSIEQVEKVLGLVHDEYKKTKNKEGLDGIALEFATYIISTIEKNLAKGRWERDSKEFGKDVFPYTLADGRVIFPYAWCQKRIFDGEGDNIWTKYNTLVINGK